MYAQTYPQPAPVTPMNPYQKRAAASYKTTSDSALSDREAMVEAYRVLMNNTAQARDAYSQRAVDVMLRFNLKSIKIIDVLREELAASDALKDPEAMPPARFLLHRYRQLIIRLSDVLTTPDPVAEFNEIIDLIKPLYRAWQNAAPAPAADDGTTEAATVMLDKI